MPVSLSDTVAIVGGGASGVLAAHALAARGAWGVTIVDPDPGRGLAYGGSETLHLLNTRASNMSVAPDDPGRFVRWLNAHASDSRWWHAHNFAPRRLYGAYLQDELGKLVSSGAARLVRDRAIAVRRRADGWAVALEGGGRVEAGTVILATGNPRPEPLQFKGRELIDDLVLDDPWDETAIRAILDEGCVLLVGTGLTAVDVAVTLIDRLQRVSVLAASRRGQLPRVHRGPPPTLPAMERPYPRTARGLYRRVREMSEALGGQDVLARHPVFLGLRSIVPELWAGLPLAEKHRFMRHLRAWWEVERHRVSPEIAAILRKGEEQGRFAAERGRIVAAEPSEDGARVTLGSGERRRTVEVTRIVNCTGPNWRLTSSQDPLLGSVLAAGAKLDEMGLGLCAGAAGEITGIEGLYGLGPLTRGTFFEITAVPEIRAKAQEMAARITGRIIQPERARQAV